MEAGADQGQLAEAHDGAGFSSRSFAASQGNLPRQTSTARERVPVIYTGRREGSTHAQEDRDGALHSAGGRGRGVLAGPGCTRAGKHTGLEAVTRSTPALPKALGGRYAA